MQRLVGSAAVEHFDVPKTHSCSGCWLCALADSLLPTPADAAERLQGPGPHDSRPGGALHGGAARAGAHGQRGECCRPCGTYMCSYLLCSTTFAPIITPNSPSPNPLPGQPTCGCSASLAPASRSVFVGWPGWPGRNAMRMPYECCLSVLRTSPNARDAVACGSALIVVGNHVLSIATPPPECCFPTRAGCALHSRSAHRRLG